MKNAILATALIAAVSAAAAPAFAMDNAVSENRAKVERILAEQRESREVLKALPTHVMTFSAREPMQLDRYEAAEARLFAHRSPPAGK